MSVTHAKIRSALRAQLLLLPIEQEFIAEENRVFTPVIGIPYVRETFKPQGSDLGSLGPNGRIRHKGLYLIDCMHKSGVGTSEYDERAGALLSLFPPAKVLTYGGLSVTIDSSYRSGSLPSADWVMVPVTISWYADTYNTI